MRKLLLLLAAFIFFKAQAQTPVQVNAQLLPPYSLQVSDYYSPTATGGQKLNLILLNRDFLRATINVRLRMVIESQGVRIATREDVTWPTVTLISGTPYYVTPAELASYFNPNNLIFSGISQEQYTTTGRLPEGFYTFCFETVEPATGLTVSNKGCAFAWITISDPPFLNIPAKAETVTPNASQNINFQWTPRHTASPNAGYNTDYVFSITEVLANDFSPESAFTSHQALYTDSTAATMYNYGPAKPLLIVGKRYAWRVQAKAKQGLDNLAMFRNNGYSEVFWFDYKNNCTAPTNIIPDIKGSRVTITWQPLPIYLSYKVQYREANNASAEWFYISTLDPIVVLNDLSLSKTYEYRVGASCEEESFNYSNLLSFTTGAAAVPVIANCGDSSAIPNSVAQNYLATIAVGDTIKAGDFNVKILTISGSESLTGTGTVKIPWLLGVKAQVRFNGIKVNTLKQLAVGNIETTYDPKEAGILNVDDVIDIFCAGCNVGNVVTGQAGADTTVKFPIQWPGGITAVAGLGYNPPTVNGPATITITGVGGTPVITIVAQTLPKTIMDSTGNIYQVNNTNPITVTLIGKAGGKDWLARTTKSLIDADKAIVKFVTYNDPKVIYAFDEWNPLYKKSGTFNKEYEKISCAGGGDCIDGGAYYVSAKAIAPGKTDYLKVVVTKVDNSIDPDSIQFVNGKGLIYTKKRVDSAANVFRYEIAVVGGPEKDAQEIYALYPRTGSKTFNLGKVLVACYPNLEPKIEIISVNGANVNLDSIKNTLKYVYGKINVNWNIKPVINFSNSLWEVGTADEKLDIQETNLFSSYTQEMKNLIKEYEKVNGYARNTIYLFVLKEPNLILENKVVLGDMPRAQRFGFVFTQNPYANLIGKVAAHEVGHGFFNLKHIKDYSDFTEGILGNTNLMDYPNGLNLAKKQWDYVHDPALVIGGFDSYNSGLDIYPITTNFGNDYPSFISRDNVSIPFLTPAGEIIYLPKNVINPVFAYGVYQFSDIVQRDLVPGVLTAFTLKIGNIQVKYSAVYVGNSFKGYIDDSNSQNIYNDLIAGFIPPNQSNPPPPGYETLSNNPPYVIMGLATFKGWKYFKVKTSATTPIFNKRVNGTSLPIKTIRTTEIIPFSDNNILNDDDKGYTTWEQAPAIYSGSSNINPETIFWLQYKKDEKLQCTNQIGKSSYLPKIKLLQLQNFYKGISDKFCSISYIGNDYRVRVFNTPISLNLTKYWEKYVNDNPILREKVLNGTDQERYEFYLTEIDSLIAYSARINIQKAQLFESLNANTNSLDANDILKLYSDDEISRIPLDIRIALIKVLSNFNPEVGAWAGFLFQINDKDEAPGVYGPSRAANIFRLSKFMPDSDVQPFLEKIISEKSFKDPNSSLFNWVDRFFTLGGIRNTYYIEFLSELYKTKNPVPSIDAYIKTTARNFIEAKNLSFDGDFFSSESYSYEINEKGMIVLATYKIKNPALPAGPGNIENYSVTANPFSYVTIVLKENLFDYKKGQPLTLTAIEALILFRSVKLKNFSRGVMIGVAAYATVASAGTFIAALSSGSYTAIGLTTLDFVASEIFFLNEISREKLSKTPEGRAHVKFWDQFLIIYGVTKAFTNISGAEQKLIELELSAQQAKNINSVLTEISAVEKAKALEFENKIIAAKQPNGQWNFSQIATDAPGIVTRINKLGLNNLQSKLNTVTDPVREGFWSAFNAADDPILVAIDARIELFEAWQKYGFTDIATLTEVANSYQVFNKFLLQKASVKTEIPTASGGINAAKKASATKIDFSSDQIVVAEVNRIKGIPITSSGERGEATEAIFNYMVNKGMAGDIKSVDGKVGSNNGIDVLAINKTGTPTNPGQIYSIECKGISQTSNSLSLNKANISTGLPVQCSQGWHLNVGNRILVSRPGDPIGNMLINNSQASILNKYVFWIDTYGNMYILKLGIF